MDRRMLLWLGSTLIIFSIVYVVFYMGGTGLEDKRELDNTSKRALEGFDPVDYHMKRAHAYESEKSFEAAADEYKKLLEINPDDSATHSHLSAIYYKMGDIDKATAEIREVLKRDPENWVQREALANLYYKQGKHDLAIREYEESLRCNPDNALGHSLLGKAYYEKGSYNFAIREYEKSLRVHPDFKEAHLGLGLCYVATGNREGALGEKRKLEGLDKDLSLQLSEAIKKAEGKLQPVAR